MMKFTDLSLSEPIHRALVELGYETPTPIQAQTLPILLDKPTDFLGLAATGTGKTAAFAIPLLQGLDPAARGVQALILCPTRELAIQVASHIDLLGKYLGIKALPIYGGAGYGDQLKGLRRGASIVVGTPGRVVDHMNKGTLDLAGVHTLVLDEADEMISMGFKDDLEVVLGGVPEGESNIWLFSATMGSEVRRVADDYLRSPRQVQVNRTEILPGTVEQFFYVTSENNKPEVLCKIIDAADDFYGIIFCQTKALVVDLHQYLRGRGYAADCLHGDMDQSARERVMKAFRDRRVTVLVATDVACRGLDVKDISHVVNYSIPRELDNYVHRIGRTGRNGKAGLALSLVTGGFRGIITRIERMTRSRMSEGRIPTRKEIGTKKVARTLAAFKSEESAQAVSWTRAVDLLDESWKTALEGMSKEEIAGRFLVMMQPETFAVSEKTVSLRDSLRPKPSGISPVKPLSSPVSRVFEPVPAEAAVITPNAAPRSKPVSEPAARAPMLKLDSLGDLGDLDPSAFDELPDSMPERKKPKPRAAWPGSEGKVFKKKKTFGKPAVSASKGERVFVRDAAIKPRSENGPASTYVKKRPSERPEYGAGYGARARTPESTASVPMSGGFRKKPKRSGDRPLSRNFR